MREIVIIHVYYLNLLPPSPPQLLFYFLVHMAEKMCFRVIYTLQQCKTSIGNSSVSIEDRVLKLAYSRRFSAVADRMV